MDLKIVNGSFEAPAAGDSANQPQPTGPDVGWTFGPNTYIDGRTAPYTNSNAIKTQDGTQVAVIQQTGSITQVVRFPVSGTYSVTFKAQQRHNEANDGTVTVDGQVVLAFTPPTVAGAQNGVFGYLFETFTTPPFAVTAGDHEIAFNGLNSAGGDNSMFLDAVSGSAVTVAEIALDPTTATTGTALTITATGTDTSWTVGTTFGVTGGTGASIDAVAISGQTATFTLHPGSSAGTLTLADSTDGALATISVVAPVAPTPTPILEDAGFEAVDVAGSLGGFRPTPAGSAWTFSGSAGICRDGGSYATENPPSPYGQQFAYLQQTGSTSQRVSGTASGAYRLALTAAQRRSGGQPQVQRVSIEVDGTRIDTFQPPGSAWAEYSSPPFDLPAGPHTITLAGTSTADDTALVDYGMLVPASILPPDDSPRPPVVPASFANRLKGGMADLDATRELVSTINALGSGQPSDSTIALLRLLVPGAMIPGPASSVATPRPAIRISSDTAKALGVALGDGGAAREVVAAIQSGGVIEPSDRAVHLFRALVHG